jgi:hypothetical protein
VEAEAGVRLSVAVMTHPARLAAARRLAGRLGGEATIACDPAPEDGPATLRTARLAWRQAGPDATHHLVVQDDVRVRPGFVDRVAEAVARFPGHALAFFAEWGSATATAVRVAALRGEGWAPVVDHYVPTQALVLPVAVAREVDGFLAGLAPDTPDDHALRDLLGRRGVPCLVSVPNLVQHDDVPSLIGNADMGLRRAVCYAPVLADARVDGAEALDPPAGLPYFSWWDRAAEFRIWDHPGGSTWRGIPLDDFFTTVGLAAATVRDGLSGATDRLAGGDPGGLAVPAPALVDLWLTGFAIGLLAAGGTGDEDRVRPRRPVAALALRSLAPGALRLLVDARTLSRREERLAEFVTEAVRAGAGTAVPGALPTRYPRTGRPAGVAG